MNKCSLCKGKLKNDQVNHMVDIDDLIIIIKKVPAVECKQCGEYYIEHEIVLKVEEIIENLKDNKAEVFIVNFDDRAA